MGSMPGSSVVFFGGSLGSMPGVTVCDSSGRGGRSVEDGVLFGFSFRGSTVAEPLGFVPEGTAATVFLGFFPFCPRLSSVVSDVLRPSNRPCCLDDLTIVTSGCFWTITFGSLLWRYRTNPTKPPMRITAITITVIMPPLLLRGLR